MTKVVINVCYGGFSLSDKGIQRYLELKGIETFPEKTKHSFSMLYYLSPKTGDEKADAYRNIWDKTDIERFDPTLVQVVEELGESANGPVAKLQVVDIPTGTLYRINEYDGFESIEYPDKINWNVA